MIHGDEQGVSLSSHRQPDAQLNRRWSLNMTHEQQKQPRTPFDFANLQEVCAVQLRL
jgi:hypothetical protein